RIQQPRGLPQGRVARRPVLQHGRGGGGRRRERHQVQRGRDTVQCHGGHHQEPPRERGGAAGDHPGVHPHRLARGGLHTRARHPEGHPARAVHRDAHGLPGPRGHGTRPPHAH
ncbi:MAG: hypothetical protein ACK56I_24430, partial [bacterium]